MPWITVNDESKFPVDTRQIFQYNSLSLLIFNIKGNFYTVKNLCTHEDQTLEEGALEGTEIICPWHGARFCVETGRATCAPAFSGLQTFPTRIKKGKIQVKIDPDGFNLN